MPPNPGGPARAGRNGGAPDSKKEDPRPALSQTEENAARGAVSCELSPVEKRHPCERGSSVTESNQSICMFTRQPAQVDYAFRACAYGEPLQFGVETGAFVAAFRTSEIVDGHTVSPRGHVQFVPGDVRCARRTNALTSNESHSRRWQAQRATVLKQVKGSCLAGRKCRIGLRQ